MSFIRKVYNWYLLREQFEMLAAFAPIAPAAVAEIEADLRSNTLNCRRWTLDEFNEWRERMRSFANDCYNNSPGFSWSDAYLRPMATNLSLTYKDITHTSDIEYITQTTEDNPATLPPLYNGVRTTHISGGGYNISRTSTVEEKIDMHNMNCAFPKTFAPRSQVQTDVTYEYNPETDSYDEVPVYSDERAVTITPYQFAADIFDAVLAVFPSLDGGYLMTNTTYPYFAGFHTSSLVYDEFVAAPEVADKCTRRYSCYGYYGVPEVNINQEVSTALVVLHGILGVATQEATKLANVNQHVIHISRQGFTYVNPASIANWVDGLDQVRWQAGVTADVIQSLTDLGCSVILYRVSAANGTSPVAVTNNRAWFESHGIQVLEIIESGSCYAVRGVAGASFSSALDGKYALMVFGACAAVNHFCDSSPAMGRVRTDIGGWNVNATLPTGEVVSPAGKTQGIFSLGTHLCSEFTHPAQRWAEFLDIEALSAVEAFRVSYAFLISRELSTAQSFHNSAPDSQFPFAMFSSGYGPNAVILSDGTVAAYARYSVCALDSITDDALLFRYKLHSPHGTPLTVSDSSLYYVGGTPYRYVDEYQPHASAMPGYAAFGYALITRWTFNFSMSSNLIDNGYGQLTLIIEGPSAPIPTQYVTVEDDYADVSRVIYGIRWKLNPGAAGERPIVVNTAEMTSQAISGFKLPHRDSKKMLLTKGFVLEGGAPRIIDVYSFGAGGYVPTNVTATFVRTYNTGVVIHTSYKRDLDYSYRSNWIETEWTGNPSTLVYPTFKTEVIITGSGEIYTDYELGNFHSRRIATNGISTYNLDTVQVIHSYHEDTLSLYGPGLSNLDSYVLYTINAVGDSNVYGSPPPTITAYRKVDGTDPPYECPNAGSYSGFSQASIVLAASYQLATNSSDEGVLTTRLSDGADIVNSHQFQTVVGRGINVPMELFPITPKYTVTGPGMFGGNLSQEQPTTEVRTAIVGKARKIIHGSGSMKSCYNKCLDRGTIAKANGGYTYTPTSVGLDFIVGIPEDADSPPTVLVVMVFKDTAQEFDRMYNSVIFNGHNSVLCPGVAFVQTSVADGVSTATWKVGIDSAVTPSVVHTTIATYRYKNETLTLPNAAALSPLFVANQEKVFDISVTVVDQAHAAANLVMYISCGTVTRTQQLAVIRPTVLPGSPGQLIFRINRAQLTPTHSKLLRPTVNIRLVDIRTFSTVATTQFNHP